MELRACRVLVRLQRALMENAKLFVIIITPSVDTHARYLQLIPITAVHVAKFVNLNFVIMALVLMIYAILLTLLLPVNIHYLIIKQIALLQYKLMIKLSVVLRVSKIPNHV